MKVLTLKDIKEIIVEYLNEHGYWPDPSDKENVIFDSFIDQDRAVKMVKLAQGIKRSGRKGISQRAWNRLTK